MALPPVGSVAPDFTLPSTDGTRVTLSSFRGKNHVLLAFFPWAFTSTCTAELCAFGDDFSRFASAGTVVLPISCDAMPAMKAFKKHANIGVDLLSDVLCVASRAYGVLVEAEHRSTRAYVIVDKAGTIRWTWEEQELGHKRENAELLAQLAALG